MAFFGLDSTQWLIIAFISLVGVGAYGVYRQYSNKQAGGVMKAPNVRGKSIIFTNECNFLSAEAVINYEDGSAQVELSDGSQKPYDTGEIVLGNTGASLVQANPVYIEMALIHRLSKSESGRIIKELSQKVKEQLSHIDNLEEELNLTKARIDDEVRERVQQQTEIRKASSFNLNKPQYYQQQGGR